MKIESGVGNGKWAAVDKHNRLETQTESASIEHTISKRDEYSFQLIGTATLASGTVVPLIIKNTSTTKDLTVSHINWQIIDPAGGTTLPNANNYLSLSKGRKFSSGGAAKTPVNLHIGSGTDADAEAYDTNPTMSGTVAEFDRWYPKDEGDHYTLTAYETGPLIINPGQTIEFSYVGDHSSGTVFVSVGFFQEDINLEF